MSALEGDDPMARVAARAAYMLGENVERHWSPDHAVAWEGFLEFSGAIRRHTVGTLGPHGDISVSMLGIMGRLALADHKALRLTDIADDIGLSLSRVSRLIDILEERKLVRRGPCAADRRATNATLSDAGLRLTEETQEAAFAFVQRNFFDPLCDEEIKTLASVFTRLLGALSAADAAAAE